MARSRGFGRGRTLLAAAILPLAGCGFHPLYASGSGGTAGPAVAGLSQISVDLIPERAGQLLRQALQARFERNGQAVAHHYDLAVAFGISGEGIAIQPDTSNARVRYIGTASYTLRAENAKRTVLTAGSVRSVDGMNVFDQQLFAADLETEAVQRRIAAAIADEIAQRLAVWFDQHATLAAAGAP